MPLLEHGERERLPHRRCGIVDGADGDAQRTILVDELVALRPSVVWVLPQRYTFSSKGKWLLGLGLRLTRGPDGNDVGLNAKLRVNFDFKRLLGLKKHTASAP